MHRLFLLIGVLAAATACGSSPTTPSSTVNTFHAEVTEGAGDAVVSAAVPTPPDLIHGTLDVGGGNLTVTIQFAPGTLGPSTVVTILLDTDQNPATGFNDTGYGIDYGVSLYASTAAFIQKANPSSCAGGGNCYTYVGTASSVWGRTRWRRPSRYPCSGMRMADSTIVSSRGRLPTRRLRPTSCRT